MYFCVCLFRWVHAVCESLYTEDEVEQASDEGFACTSCTPYVPKPVGKSLKDRKYISISNYKYYGFQNVYRILLYVLIIFILLLSLFIPAFRLCLQ